MPLPDVVSGLLLSGRPLVRIQPGVPKVAAGNPFSRVPAATFSVGKASQGSLDGGPEPRDAVPGNALLDGVVRGWGDSFSLGC